MAMNRARLALLGIFVAGMIVQLVAFIAVGHRMWPEDLQALILKLLAIYAVQLTIILGGILAQPKSRLEDPPLGLVWTAMTLAVLWNTLLVWRSISFSVAVQDSALALVKSLDQISSASSFLVSGVLVFFFVRGTEQAK